jgi:hypothetical protein
VTTTANWPQWHPSSVHVTGDADHPQLVRDRYVEELIVAGRHGECEWTVLEREVPRHWVIDARPPAGGGARITYEFTPVDDGTHFVRTMDYKMAQRLSRADKRAGDPAQVERESAQAVVNLRAVLENELTVARQRFFAFFAGRTSALIAFDRGRRRMMPSTICAITLGSVSMSLRRMRAARSGLARPCSHC